MAIAAPKEINSRLALIDAFNVNPPTTDFQRGYLSCLMDEAADDMEDAASDIFDKALLLFEASYRNSLMMRRALTLR